MKIAVTYDRGNIFAHFGKTEYFKIYTVESDAIIESEVVSTDGKGHGELVGFLVRHGVDTVICGGLGSGAKNALTSAGIKVYGGVEGDADTAVAALVSGKLEYDPNVQCDHHHDDSAEHDCAHHSCGK